MSDDEYIWLKECAGEDGSVSDALRKLIAVCRTPAMDAEGVDFNSVKRQAARFLEVSDDAAKLNALGWEKFREAAQKLDLPPRDALWVILAWALGQLQLEGFEPPSPRRASEQDS
jgi:hypothetical protein